MCGRYYIDEDAENEMLTECIRQAQARAERMGVAMLTRGEIAPTSIVPVIATSASHREQGAFPMRWGFTHPSHNVLVFNTRSETAAEKPLFCTSIDDRRCAIPASRYFEWKKESNGKKTKYAFAQETGEPLFLAGLYLRGSQSSLPCFTILTRDASDGVKEIHGRMPVILPAASLDAWLSPENPYDAIIRDAVTALRVKYAAFTEIVERRNSD